MDIPTHERREPKCPTKKIISQSWLLKYCKFALDSISSLFSLKFYSVKNADFTKSLLIIDLLSPKHLAMKGNISPLFSRGHGFNSQIGP